MQYHLNGFQGSGDPLKTQAPPQDLSRNFQDTLPEEVDVLIVGAGPAGLLLGAQLAQFHDITTRIIESKPGPLQQGQADGLQCRTVELFEAFGFSEKVLKESYWVNETVFWAPSPDFPGLVRTGRIRDTEEGLSEFPHVILNQARLHELWLDAMRWSPNPLEPSYSRRVAGLTLSPDDGPVTITIDRIDDKHKDQQEIIKAKYVVGCDGARSIVRQQLGLEMKGDYANQAWGVLDALVETDYPDLRLKSTIRSANDGTILLIPREGGYLARFYIELPKLNPNERIAARNVTADTLIDKAQRIFAPFKFEVKHVAYWSVYEVGQRLTDHFDDVPATQRANRNPRVFVAGDACHTHSAKAGQGMNVSMNDSWNLGWKLASVVRGLSDPQLLHTYSEERQDIAHTLIEFDREISRMYAAKPKATRNGTVNGDDKDDDDGAVDATVFQRYFQRQGRFMAGLETKYKPSPITSEIDTYQGLARGFEIGTRFQSTPVVRLADAKPVQLGHVMKADGRWRIVLFGDSADPTNPYSALSRTCDYLSKSLVPRYTPRGANIDSVIDVRAVLQRPRQSIQITLLPSILLPHKGKFGIQDYEKVFTDEPSYNFGHGEIFRTRGIDGDKGAVVVVRPDQYIAAVWPLGKQSTEDALDHFFAGFMCQQ